MQMMMAMMMMISMISKLLKKIDKTVSFGREIVTFLKCSKDVKAIQTVLKNNKVFVTRYWYP